LPLLNVPFLVLDWSSGLVVGFTDFSRKEDVNEKLQDRVKCYELRVFLCLFTFLVTSFHITFFYLLKSPFPIFSLFTFSLVTSSHLFVFPFSSSFLLLV